MAPKCHFFGGWRLVQRFHLAGLNKPEQLVCHLKGKDQNFASWWISSSQGILLPAKFMFIEFYQNTMTLNCCWVELTHQLARRRRRRARKRFQSYGVHSR